MSDGLDRLFADQPPTLSPAQVADLLGMTTQGVYHWLRDGVIPAYKVGTNWRVIRDELKDTMRQGTNRPPGTEDEGE